MLNKIVSFCLESKQNDFIWGSLFRGWYGDHKKKVSALKKKSLKYGSDRIKDTNAKEWRKWNSTIYFNPKADNKAGGKEYEITDKELNKKMKKLIDNEMIVEIFLCKVWMAIVQFDNVPCVCSDPYQWVVVVGREKYWGNYNSTFKEEDVCARFLPWN